MRSLRQALSHYPRVYLEELARYLGLSPSARDQEEVARALAAHLLAPDVWQRVYDQLSPAAREALLTVAHASWPLAWPTFVRRWGPIREGGFQRLLREQPWRHPASPGEELFFRGLVFRATVQQEGTVAEIVYVPDDLRLLLPEQENPQQPALPFLSEVPAARRSGRAFLNDIVMLLAFIYNEEMLMDWEGRPLRGALAELGRRLLVPLLPQELQRPSPRVHLLFHHVRLLGLVTQEGNRLRVRARTLARWLKQPVAYQRFTLWRAWAESALWHDLYHVPALECVEPPRPGEPLLTRTRFLAHLSHLDAEAWYALEDLLAWLHEHDPDFLRPHGDYQAWLIRDREQGTVLRGFDAWWEVEGRLARFYVLGPLFWLDATQVDEEGQRFALTDAGHRWLKRRSEPMRKERPRLAVSANLRIRFPHTVHPFDHFRVSRFADWERSTPEYVYRITEESVARARAQGISPQRIIAFLQRASGSPVPRTVYHFLRGKED